MKSKKIVAAALIVIAALCATPAFAQAQKPSAAAPSVELVYFENTSGNMSVFDQKKKPVEFEIGSTIQAGWTIVTEDGDIAELKLVPNGTIIKISQMTNFTVTSLQGQSGGTNAFALGLGKIRMVASKATGGEKYAVKGPTAVCGVRGTDFGMEVVPGASETAYVLDGLIDYTIEKTGQTIQIAKGMMADALSAAFSAVQIPSAMLQSIQNDMNFKKLSTADVPTAPLVSEAAPSETAPATPPALPPETPAAGTPSGAAAVTPGPLDGVLSWLKDVLGMEIGSITINNVTYGKAVLSPTFTIDKLKLGLYLPIIYTSDMLNPNDWYRPAGNFEWDFGFGGAEWDPWDTLNDVVLKIKFIEWGDNRDPFFFKAGNLNDITLGHGLVMRNFANDAEFPAVRRVGLNLGMDFDFVGFEAMVNDAANPDILGARVYARPIPGFKAAVGLSLVTDLEPAEGLNMPMGPVTLTADMIGNPIFFNPGIDLDVPVVESDILSLVGFADAAVLLPYFRTDVNPLLGAIPAGLAVKAVYDETATMPLRNYGVAAGVFGNVLMVDYRLEYRYFTGTFTPAMYDTAYERSMRKAYAVGLIGYLNNPTDPQYNQLKMGIYGEGGFKLDNICNLTIGYFWPWGFDTTGNIVELDTDHLTIGFTLEKGVIPVVDIFGSVTYERTRFAKTLGEMISGTATTFNLLDANTVVKAKIGYAVAPTLDVILLYTTTARLNPDGTPVYGASGFLPEMNTTLAIETSVHF